MNRRDFLKLGGMGALTVFLSGCGLSALMGTEKTSGAAATPEKGTISGGKNMKIVVINSSPHSDAESTSKYISQKFTEGAQSAGHEVFVFDAAKADTHPCAGCDACHMDGPCVYSDDIENTPMPKMLDADLLVLVTPLYYWTMSAQLKTVIDRFYARTGKLHKKKSMLIATCYDSGSNAMDVLTATYKRLCEYMEWNDVGMVLGTGCGARSLVESSQFPEQARQIGANL